MLLCGLMIVQMQVLLKLTTTALKLFSVFLGFMQQFAVLSVGHSSSPSYCSGLTQQITISPSSMLICFACTQIWYIYCEFHGIYAPPLVHFVINNLYLCLVTV